MRTTLTIDDDLMGLLEAERKRKGLTRKEMVNYALRRGLSAAEASPSASPVRTRPVFMGLKPGVDPYKMNALADDMEVEAIAARRRHDSA